MSQRRQFHLAFYGRVGRIGELGEQRAEGIRLAHRLSYCLCASEI